MSVVMGRVRIAQLASHPWSTGRGEEGDTMETPVGCFESFSGVLLITEHKVNGNSK
jgi:hypothetical protein